MDRFRSGEVEAGGMGDGGRVTGAAWSKVQGPKPKFLFG